MACKRKFKNQASGKYESDFIPFVAFGKTAELIANHFEKGQGIQIEAHMQSGDYEKDGVKHYTLEAVAESVEFMGYKNGQSNNTAPQNNNYDDMNPVDDGDIPF